MVRFMKTLMETSSKKPVGKPLCCIMIISTIFCRFIKKNVTMTVKIAQIIPIEMIQNALHTSERERERIEEEGTSETKSTALKTRIVYSLQSRYIYYTQPKETFLIYIYIIRLCQEHFNWNPEENKYIIKHRITNVYVYLVQL